MSFVHHLIVCDTFCLSLYHGSSYGSSRASSRCTSWYTVLCLSGNGTALTDGEVTPITRNSEGIDVLDSPEERDSSIWISIAYASRTTSSHSSTKVRREIISLRISLARAAGIVMPVCVLLE
eukprot:IDg22680t1